LGARVLTTVRKRRADLPDLSFVEAGGTLPVT